MDTKYSIKLFKFVIFHLAGLHFRTCNIIIYANVAMLVKKV